LLQSSQAVEQSEGVLKQTTAILDIISTTPDAIIGLQNLISANDNQQTVQNDFISKGIMDMTAKLDSITLHSKRTLMVVRNQGAQIKRAIKQLFSLMNQIKLLVQMYVL
jgi:hypothetical protein